MKTQDPISKFQQWWALAKRDSPLRQKNAVCLSTINEQGFPSGRFLDLKGVSENGFIFCTCLDSHKARDIKINPKVALTFWWDHVGYQVRVTGAASGISEESAIRYWKSRSKDAQITTGCCQQSGVLVSEDSLLEQCLAAKENLGDNDVLKPSNWGGYIVEPFSIEFLTFRESRLHLRELFLKNETGWESSLLQP